MKKYKVAIIEIPYDCQDEYYEQLNWEETNIPQDQWREVTNKELSLLQGYFTTLTGANSHKYKATKGSHLRDRRFKLILACEPEVIDLSIQEALNLAQELEEEKQKKQERAEINRQKREEKAKAAKRKQLEDLKKELGDL